MPVSISGPYLRRHLADVVQPRATFLDEKRGGTTDDTEPGTRAGSQVDEPVDEPLLFAGHVASR
jgi:hypothetical protein